MSSANTGTDASRGDRTRAAILDHAAEHLAAHGLEGLRGRHVAAAAGVSEATVWFHFGTKPGLLVAVMESYYDDLVVDLSAVIDAERTPRDRLVAFARFWLARMEADLPLVGELGRHGRFGPDGDIVTAFAACNRRVTQRFERLIEDLAAAGELRAELPPRLVRDLFFGAAEHVLLGRHLAGRTDPSAGDLADGVLDVILHGAAPATDVGHPQPTLQALDAKVDRVLAALDAQATPTTAATRLAPDD